MGQARASWLYVMVPVKAATAAGLDVGPHLRACGIDLQGTDPKDAWFPYENAQRLWYSLADAAKDPAWGLTVACAQTDDPASWGVFEYVFRNSDNFGDALDRVARYARLMQDQVTAELRHEEAGARFLYRAPDTPLGPNQYAGEWAAAAWVMRGRRYLGFDFVPVEVTFRHPKPKDTRKYDEVFRCPAHFGRSETSVLVGPTDLVRPVLGADVALLHIVDAHAKDLVSKLPAHALDSQVRTYLAKALSTGGDSSLAAIAKSLALSTRTLQRKLQDDGLSHREIVDDIRKEFALNMVRNTDLSNGEIAFLLGFAEATVFLRAFKRWTGGPPGDLRKK